MPDEIQRAIIIARSALLDQHGRFIYHPETMNTAIKTLKQNDLAAMAGRIESVMGNQQRSA
jgi:hypothetical protein